MDNLEERQREMRESNLAAGKKNKTGQVSSPAKKAGEPQDVGALKDQIEKLQKHVLTLEAENQRLRAEKTIVVERPSQKSSEDSVREQRHNFFKYSNVRRY